MSISPFWRRNDGDEGGLQINFYWSGAEVDWVITWRGQRRYQRIFHKKKFRRSQSFENEILKIFSSFQIFMEVSCFWCLPYLPITSLTDHSSEYEVFCNFHSNEYFIQNPQFSRSPGNTIARSYNLRTMERMNHQSISKENVSQISPIYRCYISARIDTFFIWFETQKLGNVGKWQMWILCWGLL